MSTNYVGDSGDVIKRIRGHCGGNVEGSALRQTVAQKKGYRFTIVKRASGTYRRRIDLVNPRVGETDVSNYIRSGKWKYVICDTYDEAHAFQWYVIERVNPQFNQVKKAWDPAYKLRYEFLFKQLLNSNSIEYRQLSGQKTGPGVYIHFHENTQS